MKVPQELVKIVHRLENALNSPEAQKVTLTFDAKNVKMEVSATQTGGSDGQVNQ